MENQQHHGRFGRACAAAAALMLAGAGSAEAANILLQTNNSPDSTTPTALEDAPLVSFLTGLGHVVTTRGVNAGAIPTTSELANVDLIIVSRNTTSGDYDDPVDGTNEANQWNALDKPLLLLGPHLARASHWGFVNGAITNGTNGTADNEDVALTSFNPYTDPNHPFVAGAGTTIYPDNAGRIDYVGSTEVPTGATLVATATAPQAVGTQDLAAIVDIPEGTTMFGNRGTAGDRRVFFLMNDYPDQGGVQWGLAPSGQQILGNIITELTVPEPGSAAALVGIGACALLRRRRA